MNTDALKQYTVADIQSLAEKQLQECCSSVTYPVNIVKILEEKGFECRFFEPSKKTKDISGAVSHDRKIVYINSKDAYTRQQFTLAHELGHIVLHKNENLVDYRRLPSNLDGEGQTKETQANIFAANLLMPECDFKDVYNDLNGDIDKIAAYFGVSWQAASIRIDKLGLI